MAGESFNDATTYSLTLNDFVIGVNVTTAYDKTITTLSFIYSNKAVSKHGYGDFGRPPTYSSVFNLLTGESINGVVVYQGVRDIINQFKPNGTNVIVGLQFLTNHGRQSNVLGSMNGIRYEDICPDYKLAYVRGRSVTFIDGVQFIWTKAYPQNQNSMIGNI